MSPAFVRISRQRDRIGGQALAEFALVLPLLLLLLMGLIDLGRITFTYIALEDAAQEGAIYAAHEPTDESAIIDRVKTSSNHGEVVGATVTVTCTTSPAPGTVTVTASHDIAILTPIGSEIFGGTFHLSATFIGTNFKGAC